MLINHKISIIIPTYNSESTLPKTIASIRRQQFSDLEVIIIDGLSSDSTLEVAHRNRDVITKIVSEKDDGIYHAINKGINLSSGELILILGSDDELCEDALNVVYEKWKVAPVDIISGSTIFVNHDKSSIYRVDEDYGIGALLSGIPFCHNAMFVTPETYIKVGKYNTDYKICADAEWVHRAIRLCCTCNQICTPIVRFATTGLSSTNPEQILNETYNLVMSNFKGLNQEDAKILFESVRGWSDDKQVYDVLKRNVRILGLQAAYEAALISRERRREKKAAVANKSIYLKLKQHALRVVKKLQLTQVK